MPSYCCDCRKKPEEQSPLCQCDCHIRYFIEHQYPNGIWTMSCHHQFLSFEDAWDIIKNDLSNYRIRDGYGNVLTDASGSIVMVGLEVGGLDNIGGLVIPDSKNQEIPEEWELPCSTCYDYHRGPCNPDIVASNFFPDAMLDLDEAMDDLGEYPIDY